MRSIDYSRVIMRSFSPFSLSGKVWKAPEERETTETAEDDEEIPLSMDLKTDYDDLLDGAEEDDLKDIGAILGLNFFPELTKATK